MVAGMNAVASAIVPGASRSSTAATKPMHLRLLLHRRLENADCSTSCCDAASHCAHVPLLLWLVFFCRLMPTCASRHAVNSHLPLNALQPPSNSCCEPLILVGSCVPSRHMFSACATVLHALFIASLTPHTFTSVFRSPVDQSRM